MDAYVRALRGSLQPYVDPYVDPYVLAGLGRTFCRLAYIDTATGRGCCCTVARAGPHGAWRGGIGLAARARGCALLESFLVYSPGGIEAPPPKKLKKGEKTGI